MLLSWLIVFFFADDTKIFFKDKCLNTLHDIINDELCNIATWFKLNQLSLHVKKTNFILFRGGHKSIKNSDLCIQTDDVNVERVYQTKFVGVIINERLNWNDHIIAVCSKVSKNTGILYRTRKNLNVSTLMLLYQTPIQPYFEYCNVLWCIDDSQYLNKLFAKQKSCSNDHFWKMELSYCTNICKV